MGLFRSMDFTRQQEFRVGSPPRSASNSRDLAKDTPVAETSSYDTFDTLCGLVFSPAVLVLAAGACLVMCGRRCHTAGEPLSRATRKGAHLD